MSNYIGFQQSHARHHRYTLHQPDDQEVKLPVAKVLVRHFILTGIVNPLAIKGWLTGNARVACGRIEGEWETMLFPPGSAERREFVNWQRTMIAGHMVLILTSIYFHLWLLPVLVTLGPFYGGWLQFLYWHMNYHIEHHMFAAVPCYRLGRLHRLIKHDLPPCPHGMLNTWKEIAAIQKIQETDPTYEHMALIPQRAKEGAAVPV
jgi:fatty acid desaturase